MAIRRLQGEWERRNGYYFEFDPDSEPLGEGGMGVVYLGYCVSRHSESKHYVAIKQLREDLSHEGYQRAVREASIKIRHENLVEMLGFITSVENDPFEGKVTRHYVISEFLYGVLLSDVLLGKYRDNKGNDIPFVQSLCHNLMTDKVNAAVDIVRSVLSGIQTLHDKGYIHRDIDPSNIMVTASGQIKLIDFGIAKEVNTLGKSDRLITVAGEFVGKPEYAAPELVLGDIKAQNYHTDLYSVGILLFQLLADHLPFVGSRYEVFQQQLKKPVPVKQLHVSDPLKNVIKKATAKNADKRYLSAAEFRVELDKAVQIKQSGNVVRWLATASVAICCVIGGWLGWKSLQDRPDEVVLTELHEIKDDSQVKESYENACALLASADPYDIRKGYEILTKMADDGDASAKAAVARVLFPAIDKLNDGTAKDELIGRREALGLTGMDTREACTQVISYLNPGTSDVLECYMLGYSYWRLEKFDEAVKALSRAEELHQTSQTQDVSLEEIRKRLLLCRKQLNN